MTKWVYAFGDGKAEGKAGMKNLLGGKGANLAEMSNLGLPVPPGFTITTEVCTYYYANKRNLSRRPEGPGRRRRCARSASWRKRQFGRSRQAAAAVSVRSGARVSMPGMMDTVLNLGLNAADRRRPGQAHRRCRASPMTAIAASSRCIPTWCWAWTMPLFEEILDDEKDDKGVELDTELDADDLKRIAGLYKERVEKELGKPFPGRCAGTAVGRHRRGVRQLAEPRAPTPIAG